MAGENLQFAAAIIVEPLGPPCSGVWRSSKTLAGSAPGWLVFVIMSRAPKYRNVASFTGLLLGLNLVDGASRMNVEARLAVQRTFAMPIERRGADAALRFGFRASWRVFEGAYIRLTPVSRKGIKQRR
jgi:hypothetical protein